MAADLSHVCACALVFSLIFTSHTVSIRTIRYTNKFNRDYKREKSGKSRQYSQTLDRELTEVVALLAPNAVLPRRYADQDAASLELVRLGSHSELGL